MKKSPSGFPRTTPGLAASAVLLSLLLTGCASEAGATIGVTGTDDPSAAPSASADADADAAVPSSAPTTTATPLPGDAALAAITIGPDDVRLVFDDGSARPFGYLDEPAALLSALTEELGEEPVVEAYAGDPDCGASTSYSFSPGIRVRRLDPMEGFEEPGEEGPLDFTVFADASARSEGSVVSVTTSAGGELGAPADSVFSSVPASWIDAGADSRAAVITSSTVLGPVQDVDEEGVWLERWGLAIAEERGVLTEIGSPVGLAYFC